MDGQFTEALGLTKNSDYNTIVNEITTTFASNYTKEVSLSEMLDADSILTYAKQATGEKYLVTPHK